MPRYIVALAVGGVMEKPDFTYEKHQVIRAGSPKEAESIYRDRNGVIGSLDV